MTYFKRMDEGLNEMKVYISGFIERVFIMTFNQFMLKKVHVSCTTI